MVPNFNDIEEIISSFNRFTDDPNSVGFPIPEASVQDLTSNFSIAYKSAFINPQGTAEFVNQTIINNQNLKIKVADIVSFLGINPEYNNNNGAALFYILDLDNNNNRYFTYAITPATYDYNQKKVIPILNPNPNEQYLVPTWNGSFKKIDEAEFQVRKNDYLGTIKIRELSYNQALQINTLEGITTKKHPTNCFYSDEQIYKFHKDNKDIAANPDLFYLKIVNGAIYKNYNTQDQYYSFKVQVPILIFQYDNALLSNDSALVQDKPYENKAMDVGRLCPPSCP